MPAGLEIRILWCDYDMVEIRVSASNGVFAGAVDLYIEPDGLKRLADTLSHFPSSSLDRREVTLGTFIPDDNSGNAKLMLRCIDGTGHSILELIMKGPKSQQPIAMSQFSFPIEPSAIDRFVAQLKSMQVEVGASIILEPAT